MKRLGKRGREWENARRRLKKKFFELGIDFCEICGSRFGLSFAHSKKRRHIEGDELTEVALVCIHPCHAELERLPEPEMTAKVRSIISNRGV